jgi:hypothetical protein
MNIRDLQTAVRGWCNANYPGCKLEYITIHARDLPCPLTIRMPRS